MPEPKRHRSRAAAGRAVARICRQWTGGKTGVPVAVVLVAALLLLPALQPVLASPPRAARYEAYPWTGWQKLDEAEQKRLTRIAYGGKDYDSMVQAWYTKSKAGVWDEPFPEYSYRWADAEPHPELARLLPEVRFLGQRVKINPRTTWPGARAVALFDGRLYELGSLNKLLVDAGYRFDTSEVAAVAKIAVLWALMDRHAGSAFPEARDSAALATAIPAVTFRRIERREWRDPTYQDLRRSVVVSLLVDGKPHEMVIRLNAGTYEPQDLFFDGGKVNFIWVWPPRGETRGGGVGLASFSQWTIEVTGESLWTELDHLGRAHHFVCVQTNSSPTNCTLRLKVDVGSDTSTHVVHYRWLRVQDSVLSWITDTVEVLDTTRLSVLLWRPTYDSTAEYKVTAHRHRDSVAMSDPVILDPEAWRTGVLSGGKPYRVQYMKYNDADPAVDADSAATLTTQALTAAWDAERRWLPDTTTIYWHPPDSAVKIVMGRHSRLPWYHWVVAVTLADSNSCWFSGGSTGHYKLLVHTDWDQLCTGGYATAEEAFRSALAHELWHGVHTYLRQRDGWRPSGGAELTPTLFQWTHEGMATAAVSIVQPDAELRRGTLTSLYKWEANAFLNGGLGQSLYNGARGYGYRFCLLWRTLHEIDNHSTRSWVAVCSSYLYYFDQDTTRPFALTESLFHEPLTACNIPGYSTFREALHSFHVRCCLTRAADTVDGVAPWDSGGPNGIYPLVRINDSATYSTIGDDTLVKRIGALPAQTGYVCAVRLVPHPGVFPLKISVTSPNCSTEYRVTAVIGPDSAPSAIVHFDTTRLADSLCNSAVLFPFDDIYLVISNVDTVQPSLSDDMADSIVLVIRRVTDVAVEDALPYHGQPLCAAPGAETHCQPTAFVELPILAYGPPSDSEPETESLAVSVDIYPLRGSEPVFTADTTIAWDDGGRRGVEFGDCNLGHARDTFRMVATVSAHGDTNPANDTIVTVFTVEDAIADSTEDFGDDDGKRWKHLSEHGSCWHPESASAWWESNNTRYMCLRWHDSCYSQDWLWLPSTARWARGNLKARFKCRWRPRSGAGNATAELRSTDDGGVKFSFVDSLPGECDTVIDGIDVNSWRRTGTGYVYDSRPLFYYAGDSTMIEAWCVDDFQVYSDSSDICDVALQNIAYPYAGYEEGASYLLRGDDVSPKVVVRNFGMSGESCYVHFQFRKNVPDSVLWADSQRVFVPYGSSVEVVLSPWTVAVDDNRCQAYAWVSHPRDQYAGNDSCKLGGYGCFVVDPGIYKVEEFPLGSVKKTADISTDGAYLYVKGGRKKEPVLYRYRPETDSSTTSQWDTLQTYGLHEAKGNGGGLVYTPSLGHGGLWLFNRRNYPLLQSRLGDDEWTAVPYPVWEVDSIKLKLTTAMCYGPDGCLYALNRHSRRRGFHSIVRYSPLSMRWTEVCRIPKLRSSEHGGLSRIGNTLYRMCGSEMGAGLMACSFDSLQFGAWRHIATPPPVSPNSRKHGGMLATNGTALYTLWNRMNPGVYRLIVGTDSWVLLDTVPMRIENGDAHDVNLEPGAAMECIGDDVYFFTGKIHDLWRYIGAAGESFEGMLSAVPAKPTAPGTRSSLLTLDSGEEWAVDTSDYETADPDWSPGGESLAYIKEDTSGWLQVYCRWGTGDSVRSLTSDASDKELPRWSPDGQWILYQYGDDNGVSQLAKVNTADSVVQLTTGTHDCENGHWTPDGLTIVFQRSDDDGYWQICRVGSSGGTVTQITSGPTDHEWPCADSSNVYYSRMTSGYYQLFKTALMGNGDGSSLSLSTYDYLHPSLSADLALLTCATERADGHSGITVFDLAEPEELTVVTDSALVESPSFSPDGEFVLFRMSDGMSGQVCQVPIEGGTVEPLTAPTDEVFGFAVSPDGRYVAFAKEDSLSAEPGIYKARRFTGSGVSEMTLGVGAFDATTESLAILVNVEGPETLTLSIRKGTTTVRTLLSSVPVEAGDYCYWWDGRLTSGSLALPDSYAVWLTAKSKSLADTVRVKGTLVSGDAYGTWSTANSPYVLTGDVTVPSSAVLTIAAGARVLPRPMPPESAYEINVNGTLVARGSSGSRILFSPYRKLVPAPDSAAKGSWLGIRVDGTGGEACTLDYCVLEYGGNQSLERGIVDVSVPSGVSVTNSVLRGSPWAGVNINEYQLDGTRVAGDSFLDNQIGLPFYPMARLPEMTQTCWFEDNFAQQVAVKDCDDVEANATWQSCGPGMKLFLDNGFDVCAPTGACTLRITAGLTVTLPEGDDITVGDADSGKAGVLLAQGQPGSGWVSFTGNGWRGIKVLEDDGPESRFRYCKFSGVHGGYNPAALLLNGGRAVVERCSLYDCRDADDHDARAVRVLEGRLTMSQTYVADNDVGLECDNDAGGLASLTRCQFSACDTGLRVSNDSNPTIQTCNFTGNARYALCNRKGATNVTADSCWWGATGGPHGGDTVWRVSYSPVATTPHWILPPIDVAADTVLNPIGWTVGDTDVVDTPRAVVGNDYDDTLSIAVRLVIGADYSRLVNVTLPGNRSDTVEFPAAVFAVGRHNGLLAVSADGDSSHANDTFRFTFDLRDSVDIAALAVTAPTGPISVEDSVRPAVLVANLTDTTRTFPVRLDVDCDPFAAETVTAGPGETLLVEFDRMAFTPGEHSVGFTTLLAGDDDPANDTASIGFAVAGGDYWRQMAAPSGTARCLAWDGAQKVVAAGPGGGWLESYDIPTDSWGLLSGPPADSCYGLTLTRRGLVALVKPAGTLDAQETGPGTGSEDRSSLLTSDYALYRRNAAADSWELLAEVEPQLAANAATGIAADGEDRIFVVEGQTTRLLTYDAGAASWDESNAPYTLDRNGAIAWTTKPAYMLADGYNLLGFDPDGNNWEELAALPEPDNLKYGWSLCADPLTDELYAFADWKFFYCRRNDRSRWEIRSGTPTQDAGTILAWANGRVFALDSVDGFRCYRPGPLRDAAAVAATVVDTVPRDSSYAPRAVVQSYWLAPASVGLELSIGTYSDDTTVTVGAFERDTVAFRAVALAGGTHSAELTVDLSGDSVAFNNTCAGTVVARYRRDAAAVAVTAPVDVVRFDSLLVPAGLIQNRHTDTLAITAVLTIDSVYADTVDTLVAGLATALVTFDTCRLRLGEHEVVLAVHADGDEVAANDTARTVVEVKTGDMWIALADLPEQGLRLADGDSAGVLGARRTGWELYGYEPAGDTWTARAESPLADHYALERAGSRVFALGHLRDPIGDAPSSVVTPEHEDAAAPGRAGPATAPAVGTDGPWAIAAYDAAADTWYTLTTSVSANPGDGAVLFAVDESTLYVLDVDAALWRYDVQADNWTQKNRMPDGVCTWTSGCRYDSNRLFALTGWDGELYAYDVAADSWSEKPAAGGGMPEGSALAADPGKGILYAFWAGNGDRWQEYDVAGEDWIARAKYNGALDQPSATLSLERVYGTGGSDRVFCRYLPEQGVDVAAVAQLAPADTVRVDSTLWPVGVVRNYSPVPVWCQTSFSLGNIVLNPGPVYLDSGAVDTVYYGSFTVQATGALQATLTATCDGDSNGGNYAVQRNIWVEGTWEPRTAPAFAKGRLDAPGGDAVYAAEVGGPVAGRYSPSGDSWVSLPGQPFAAGCLDLARADSACYALGADAADGKDETRPGFAGPGLDAGELSIYALADGDSLWLPLTESVPFTSTSPDVPWIVAANGGIYAQSGNGRELWYFAVDTLTGWQLRESLPVTVQAPSAMDWDRGDALFLLTYAAPESAAFLVYSLTGDSWTVLEPLAQPVTAGLALAAEPDSGTVLALVPGSTGPAALYEYNRGTGDWSASTGPGWTGADGAAMTWSGGVVYALTGHSAVTPGPYWCYDPAFAAFDRLARDGVAGAGTVGGRWYCRLGPNPVTGRAARLRYSLPGGRLSLAVYDVTGRCVRERELAVGRTGTLDLDIGGLASGVYLVVSNADGFTGTQKLVVKRR